MTVLVTVLGNLGKDAEVKGEGSAENISFSIAGTAGWGDKLQTIWFDCRQWQPSAQQKKVALAALKKGTRCLITGEMSIFIGSDGAPRNQLSVRSINVVSKAFTKGESKTAKKEEDKPVEKPFDDEIPF